MTRPALSRLTLRRFTSGTTTAGLLLLGAPVAIGGAPAVPDRSVSVADPRAVPATDPADLAPVSHRVKHPQRKIKRYRVRRGDTPSEIAVRYHAWTAQLIAINHTSTLHIGQVIRIPVVVEAARACTRHRHHHTHFQNNHRHRHQAKPDRPKQDKPKPRPAKPQADKPAKPKKPRRPKAHQHAHRFPHRGWVHANASRAEVRRVIAKKARRHGVNPDLALAISWQEAGWQQRRISPAGALGAMQVMPLTGRWMSVYVGRRLNLRNLHHNVTAGVRLIEVLRSQARPKLAIAGYYQGLAGVRRHGMYPSTKRYVASVVAIKQRLERGQNPA